MKFSRTVYSGLFFILMLAAIQANAGQWNTKAPLWTAIAGAGAGVVDSGGAHVLYLIYVVGGWDNGGFGITNMHSYNPATNTWSTEPPMKTARYQLAGDVVNGIFYAIGGQSFDDKGWVEAYDPASKTWTTKTDMPTGRYQLDGVAVNGIFYAIGGTPNHQLDYLEVQIFYSKVEAYNAAANSWTTLAPLPTARVGLKVVAVNGIIYAIGGQNATSSLATVEAYDPGTNTWTTKAPMSKARAFMYAGVMNGKIYVAGGPDASAESYDPVTNTWSLETSMPAVNTYGPSAVVGGIFYTIGGADNCTFCFPAPNSLMQAYTPVTTSVEERSTNVPSIFALQQNYPNPFNPTTTLSYSVPEQSKVTLSVFNSLGQTVAVVLNATNEAGAYERSFDASKLSSGIYFYRLEAVSIRNPGNVFVDTKRMALVK